MKALYLFPLAALGLCVVGVGTARAYPDVGSSQADLPSLVGMFEIANTTKHTIYYSVRWGDGSWKQITLSPGHRERHSYPLDGQGRAPTPHVQFDGVAHNHKRINYKMEFYAVGYSGFGSGTDPSQPKRYYFQYTPSGDSLDLFAR